ncbi:MAG: hypothetical protein COB51_14020 [Moraxellaceae bacterium]|nr:MAG: hypothetical protein COB51_14020 [Moraxellaceae bacterium]
MSEGLAGRDESQINGKLKLKSVRAMIGRPIKGFYKYDGWLFEVPKEKVRKATGLKNRQKKLGWKINCSEQIFF